MDNVAGFWVGLAFTGAGAVFALFGLVMIPRMWWVYRRAEKAEGTVADVRKVVDEEGSSLYRSVIRFTAGGHDCEVVDGLGTAWRLHDSGQRLRLYYPKDDPGRAAVWRPWWFAVYAGFIVLGLLLGLAGLTADWGPRRPGASGGQDLRGP